MWQRSAWIRRAPNNETPWSQVCSAERTAWACGNGSNFKCMRALRHGQTRVRRLDGAILLYRACGKETACVTERGSSKSANVKIALLVLLAAQLALGQDKKFAADCSGNLNLPSCKSYNASLAAKNKDLMPMLAGHTFVCFRREEDTFFVVAFDQPSPEQLAPAKGGDESQATGTVKYHRFKDSKSDDLRVITGNWQRVASGKSDQIKFAQAVGKNPPTSADDATAAIDTNEISVGYSFLNAQKVKLNYALQLHRSPLGFVENYEWTDAATNQHGHSTYTGDCLEFH
jgi:hypothetical protein